MKQTTQIPSSTETNIILMRRWLEALEEGVSNIPECCSVQQEAAYAVLHETARQLQGLSVVLHQLQEHQRQYLAGMN